MKILKTTIILLLLSVLAVYAHAQRPRPEKPRIIVSSDIGGTDPDDNQSMIHLLMYNDMFDIEGLVSSPSFGNGSADEIKRMIGIYEKDYDRLKKHAAELVSPDSLRRICKQGRRGLAPFKGYDNPTEGSEWIVAQARRKSDRPLWILVWGTLEDVAQALHDAPDIKDKIRIYYIGGPNKKWGVNSYAYIASSHPDVWMIENNATYRGLIAASKRDGETDNAYYNRVVSGAGHMGADFINYYKGRVKMGDTPSLLYMMDGDPESPEKKDCWGGNFERTEYTSRRIFERPTTLNDTVPVYSVIELRMKGPEFDIDEDSVCFKATIDRQTWPGYYLGNGVYAVRYSPKAPAVLNYTISSAIKELDGQNGKFVVGKMWPGKREKDDFAVGDHWFTDRSNKEFFEGPWQGAGLIRQQRHEILEDWAVRWKWLK